MPTRADLTGQRNTFAEPLSGRLEAERLARPLVQWSGNRIELCLRVARYVDALRQVVPEQPIGILVAAPLPRALWVTKVDLDIGGQGESLVPCISVPRSQVSDL